MVQGFGAEAQTGHVFTFTEAQKAQILAAKPEGAKFDGAEKFIAYFEKTGKLPAFACGSLLTYSHFEKSNPADGGTRQWKDSFAEKFPDIDADQLFDVTRGRLPGLVRDFVCHDVFYRGTIDDPGVTFGLDEREGEYAYGGIVNCDVGAQITDTQQAADFAAYYLEQFFDREFPSSMPIYAFDFREAELEDGSIVPGIACVADKNAQVPNREAGEEIYLYAGGLSFEERAQILATAYQDNKPNLTDEQKLGMMSDLDYMRTTIDSGAALGIAVDPELIELYTAAIHIRNSLPAEQKAHLRSLEKPGSHQDSNLEFMGVIGEQRNVPTHWNLEEGASSSLKLEHS